MQTKRLETLEQVRGFVEGNAGVDFELTERKSGCEFIRRTLVRFGYHGLGKKRKLFLLSPLHTESAPDSAE